MQDFLLYPPIAFVIYLVLVAFIAGAGHVLAGPERPSAMKTSVYASGEAAPKHAAHTGYNPFFVTALFFAVLHLGVLVLASGQVTQTMVVYLAGLVLVLIVLILG